MARHGSTTCRARVLEDSDQAEVLQVPVFKTVVRTKTRLVTTHYLTHNCVAASGRCGCVSALLRRIPTPKHCSEIGGRPPFVLLICGLKVRFLRGSPASHAA